MNAIEIQRALYNARNQYLKAKSEMEFKQKEIAFLNELQKNLDRDIFIEMYGELPLQETN